MLGNNRALGSVRSPETRKLMSVNNGRWNKGLHMPKEYRLKLSLAKQGERHPNWQGGKSSMNKRLRATVEYKEWRLNIFKRDDHTCVECGSRGVNLHADHIKPFAFYPELRFDITNGRTLCVPCHKKTDSYFWKANKKTYRDTLTKTE